MNRRDSTVSSWDRKLRSILDFAAELYSSLPRPSEARTDDLLLVDIKQNTNAATSLTQHVEKCQSTSLTTAKSLERHGRDLWNLCIRLKRQQAAAAAAAAVDAGSSRVLVRARVFAFAVLCLGRNCGRVKDDVAPEAVYLMGLALTLARLCLEAEDLEPARDALQKAADYLDQLAKIGDASGCGSSLIRLEADYLAMRIALSWRENLLDVAEHMFNKTEKVRAMLDVSSAEMLADTLRHVGADLLSKKDFSLAIKWLKRAYEIINSQDLTLISVEGLENRMAICHNLIQSLLGTETPEAIDEANNFVSYIESEIGDTPAVLHWKLEILQKSPNEVFDMDAYVGVLRRMVLKFDFSDASFRFLLYEIKELRKKQPRMAVAILDDFITRWILQSSNTEWLNKALVARIWMTTEAELTDSDQSATLTKLLNTISDSIAEPLSPEAAGAAHSLIWKTVEAAITKRDHETADSWCMLALHQVFSLSGPENLAKFGRKQLLCALGLNDAEKARAVFARMPSAARDDALTRYLMFKVSLLDWDHELGYQSIEYLGKEADIGYCQELIYACIRDAQQASDKMCTLSALKATIDNWKSDTASKSSLPSMIRCSIRLIIMIEEEERRKGTENCSELFVTDICTMFERAAESARQKPQNEEGNTIFTVQELTWFRKNAYNIGAQRCDTWDLLSIIRIFTACLGFIACYPQDLPMQDSADLSLMAMRCHFILAAAQISLARTTDQVAEQAQRYLEVRQHASAFQEYMCNGVNYLDERVIQDVHTKSATTIVFDFEGAVALKNWDELGTIVRRAHLCGDEVVLKAMGDCLLTSNTPGKVMFRTMRLIINQIFDLEKFDNEKLAKYVRCIYQVILPLDEDMALQLIDEALKIAREGAQAGCAPFPPEELEWIVAVTFNHAVDFYARHEESKCHKWALKAMDLATYMDDHNQMRDLLQDKFSKLRFSEVRQAR